MIKSQRFIDTPLFRSKFVEGNPDECWIWTGTIGGDGYGRIHDTRAHRLSFAVFNKRPPKNSVCHSCDNPLCVNPHHLWEGTAKENADDMSNKGRARRQNVTHCPKGHEYTPENTIHKKAGLNRRDCRSCDNARAKANYYKRKATTAPASPTT